MSDSCKACGGVGLNSKGGPCFVCVNKRGPAPKQKEREVLVQPPKAAPAAAKPTGGQELYKRRRPTQFSELVGQAAAVDSLRGLAAKGPTGFPHALLLSGPSGCGKTTIARIMRDRLQVAPMDYREVNAATTNGVDMVRELVAQVPLGAIGGKRRAWCLDEAHQLTTQAQQALLKVLEDTPAHAYFFICTTEPTKLLPTIRSRTTHIQLRAVPDDELAAYLVQVAEAEGYTLGPGVVPAIVEAAQGGVRAALVVLEQVAGVQGPEAQLAVAAGQAPAATAVAIDLCRALAARPIRWPNVAKVLAGCSEDPEAVRRAVLGYMQAILLKSDNPQAAVVIENFAEPVFNTGKPGLCLAAYRTYAELKNAK
jgi:DNA polymerase III subunit gamma/tau